MKHVLKISCFLLILASCKQQSILEKEFECNSESFTGNIESVLDVKNSFSVDIPVNWKTNLFYDDIQSSIYFADTTKQLTETVLIDITQLNRPYTFDEKFKIQLSKSDSILNFTRVNDHEFTFKKKKAYYSLSKGKKGKFSYQILNIFVKLNNFNSLHIKTEIFGDNNQQERMCKAINLFKSITFNEVK